MRTISFIITILFAFTACKFDNRNHMDRILDNSRESLKNEIKSINAEQREWDSLINNIYELSKQNQTLAYKKIDFLILNNPQFDEFNIKDLHFVKGNIFFKNDSLDKALEELTKSGINFPNSLCARAGVFLKLKEYKKCLLDLKKAVDGNSDFLWYIGNYYEVLNKKDSAIFYYNKLFIMDKTIYKYCGNRINELKNRKTELYTELKEPEINTVKIIWKE